jgi:shikimate dehydrogenase
MRAGLADNATGDRSNDLRLGLVGHGIQQSRTPAMHEAEARAQGLTCSYELFDLEGQAEMTLTDILMATEAGGYAGLNVTFPFKQDVIPLLDHLSDAARRVGAVNTVVFRDGQRFGHNTDFWGFSESLRRGLPDAKLDMVLLIGAGGAGGALAHALKDLGVSRLLIADTRVAVADELARAVGDVAAATDDLAGAAAAADGIVNATPVGMKKMPGTPIPPDLLEPRHWIADIVYFPLETAFLKEARARGCRTLSGEGMAVFQAVRAFELFSGHVANADRMRDTFRRLGAA